MAKICVIGSGPGGSPIAFELSKAGHEVIVLEKGPYINRELFNKDQIAVIMRDIYSPRLNEEFHVREERNDAGEWIATDTYTSRRNMWNGSAVGGSSNFMSGYMHRLKPKDFRLLSEYGSIEGANIADWPLTYAEMEPYYAKVEHTVGISGKVLNHSMQEPRSTPDFPFPPLITNKVGELLDACAQNLGYEMIQIPRAIISKSLGDRNPCYYSNFCGSYGCSSGAKSSAREALLKDAERTGNCTIIPLAMVYRLETDGKGKIVRAHYYDRKENDSAKHIDADIFVVACQAIETSRLLLMSKNDDSPQGLANNKGQVGKNLIFSAGGTGSGYLYYKDFSTHADALRVPGLFVNRGIAQWYEINDPEMSEKPLKGGMVEFMFEHANSMPVATRLRYSSNGELVFGTDLKKKLLKHYSESRRLRFEVFNDWLPNNDCFVSLDADKKDKWGNPVARIRLGYHPHDLKIGKYLAEKSVKVLETLGAKSVSYGVSGNPPANLQAGGCRFGTDPNKSVLDKNCKAHQHDNLYVTDGSFMPTGGSATYTWTIYANSFRVADHLLQKLKEE